MIKTMNPPKRFFELLLSLYLCLAVLLPASLAKEMDWQSVLADGYHELAIGNTEKAIDIFTRKQNKYPASAACHTALGRGYKRLGRIDDAKAEFRKATQLEPNYPDGFYELGVLQESDRNFSEAASCFEKYLQLKPEAGERQALADRIRYCRNQIVSLLPNNNNIDTTNKPATDQSNNSPPAIIKISEQSNNSVLATKPIAQSPNGLGHETKSTNETRQKLGNVQEASKQPVKQSDAQGAGQSRSISPSNQLTGESSSIAKAVQQAEQNDINRPIRDKWALIVGIGQFANPNISHLKYATKDACDLYSYLVHEANFAPDHVRMLLDEKGTQRRIMSELGSKFLARLAKPDDLVVLFFSTHGSPSQMDVRGKNYIVAYDSDPDDLFATGIEMQKILEAIQSRVLSDRVLLVLDACHSGGVTPGAKGMTRVGNFDAEAFAEGSGQMVICSSTPEQQSWESKRYENGVFTKSFLEGLRNAGPKTTLSKAFATTEQLVQDEVREDYPGARQTPVLHSKWNGNELIVGVRPSAPQKIPPTVSCDLEADSSATRFPIGESHPKTTSPSASPKVGVPK